MKDAYIAILSASIGALTALFANWWRTKYTVKSQDFSKRIEEIGITIGKLENLAAEYWANKSTAKPETKSMILGTQSKITIILSYLHTTHQNFNQDSISAQLHKFFNACSGGDFDETRTSEPERARAILTEGELLKIELLKIRNRLY